MYIAWLTFYADVDFGIDFELLHFFIKELKFSCGFLVNCLINQYYLTNCEMEHHFIGISAEFYDPSQKKHMELWFSFNPTDIVYDGKIGGKFSKRTTQHATWVPKSGKHSHERSTYFL